MDKMTSRKLGLLCVIGGGTGFFLRLMLYAIGLRKGGMLVRWQPLSILLAVTAVLMLAAAAVLSLRQPRVLRTAPTGKLQAGGSAALALCLGYMAGSGIREGLPMSLLLLGLLAALALILAAVSQWQGRQPHFLTHVVLCLFLAYYLLNRFRVWSQNPQILDHIMVLCGGVAMMLYSFEMAAGSLGRAGSRKWLFLGIMAGFFCLTGASGGHAVALCLGGALWILSGFWSGTGEGAEK